MARVVVVGAGAVGGYFGACLQRAGHDVSFVARGDNLRTLSEKGLRVTGAMGTIALDEVRAIDHAQDADLALLCVKAYDLPDAAASLRATTGLCLTLQNGVDAPDGARRVLGDRVLAGSTGIVADLPEPGRVHVVSSYAWIRFGEPLGNGVTERVRQAHRILDVEGIEAIAEADARVALWDKMALMCAMAGLTTLHQLRMGEIVGGELRATFEEIVRECETVARAMGVTLPPDFVGKRLHYADRIDPEAMSSMSRDAARGKRIELDTFNGAIVRMGAEIGIEVPANRAVYDAIASRYITPS